MRDLITDALEGQGLPPFFLEQPIEGGGEIRRGIQQGPVQIE